MTEQFLIEKNSSMDNYFGIIFIRGGLMFVGSQNFSGSRGRNFVGSKFGIILINIKQMLVDWGCNFVGKGYLESHEK